MSSPNSQKAESKLAAQSARTRALLIETALELLPEHGLQGLSLDAVASRAGVTRGAIYGHFGSRDGLIMAAIAMRPQARPDEIIWPTGREGTVRQRLLLLGEAVVAWLRKTGVDIVAPTEFLLFALTHEDMKVQVGEFEILTQRRMEANIRALFAPEELPMPAESLALLLTTMLRGLMVSRGLAGDGIKDETVLAMFEGLAGAS